MASSSCPRCSKIAVEVNNWGRHLRVGFETQVSIAPWRSFDDAGECSTCRRLIDYFQSKISDGVPSESVMSLDLDNSFTPLAITLVSGTFSLLSLQNVMNSDSSINFLGQQVCGFYLVSMVRNRRPSEWNVVLAPVPHILKISRQEHLDSISSLLVRLQ